MSKIRKQQQRKRVVIAPRKKEKEVSLLGRALRALGSAAGGSVGALIGAPSTGSTVGHGLGAAISKWIGSGDYQVTRNSIVSSARSSPSIPMMHNTGQSVVVRHKDYLGQVLSSRSFAVQQAFTLNPGQLNTFPWLCNIARRFQEYTFKGVVFHYIPTSGSISSTQELGSVMLQTTYRSTDIAPNSKTEMMNEYWACETVPSDTMVHPIECDPKENPFNVQYVRSGDVAAGETKLIYDLGTTYVATSGQSTNGAVLGDLYVTYEVELRKPVVTSNVTSSALVAARGWTGTILTFNIFGGTLSNSSGNLPCTFSGNTATFPIGTYGTMYITLALLGNAPGFSGALNTDVVPTLTNCNLVGFITNPSTGLEVFGQTLTTSTGVTALYFHIAVTKSSGDTVATVTWPAPTMTAGTITQAVIRIVNVESTA